MSTPAVEIYDASFTYEGFNVPAVHELNLIVEPGQCVVLCGSSGCGKTTVTRLVNGLAGGFFEGERTGAISIAGNNIESLEEWELAGLVGSVFQNPRTQFFNLDTTGELAFGMENLGIPHDEMHARLEGIVDKLSLKDLMNRGVLDLSGGQMQAIAFASARACEPAIYVLDEPSSNLDPPSMTRLASFIANVKAHGAAVIVAEHRLAYLADVADRYALVQEGRITKEWSAREFLRLSDEERAALDLRSSNPPDMAVLAHALGKPASFFPAVEARGIFADYGKEQTALEGLSISFDSGCVTGIVGPNGAGKSTLLKCLIGIKKETFGHVRFNGNVVFPKQRAQHAFLVMQDPGYQLFRPSVREELSTTGRTDSKIDPAQVAEALSQFGLADVADRHPASLSGGQKQRCVCALAHLSGTQAVLFDEPTSGLDFDNMNRLSSLLHAEADCGRAVIAVSHDTEFLARACDRIVLIE